MTSAPCLFLLLQSLWWNETFLLLLKYGPFPASVHFQELTVNMIITKIGRLLDSNCRPLILEASALSTEPLHYCLGPRGTNVQAPDRGRCPETRQRRNICSLARRTGTNTAKLFSKHLRVPYCMMTWGRTYKELDFTVRWFQAIWLAANQISANKSVNAL